MEMNMMIDDYDDEDEDDGCLWVFSDSVENASKSGLLTRSAGRWFHSHAVLEKKEYMWALILEYGMENLLRSEWVMLGGREILTLPVWIL